MSAPGLPASATVARQPARFGRAHLFTLVGAYACALFLLHDAVAGARQQYADAPHALLSAILGPFLGPFLGGYATAGEHAPAPLACDLLTPSLVVFAFGLAFQCAPRRLSRARLFFWTLGWTVWFGASLASLLQVLG